MLIGLDYDDTFTADVDFWCQVVALGQLRGHSFVCVTARHQPPDPEREPHVPMPVVCAGNDWKDTAAQRAGFEVDVWIDDLPELIRPEGLLRFPSEGGPNPEEVAGMRRMLGNPSGVTDFAICQLWDYARGQP